MTALELARWQFGITTVFHFLFVPLTIGLAFLVAIFQTAAHRTGNASSEVYSVRLKLGRYEVGNLGLAYCAELSDGLLNDPIRVRHALMLPEMLKPGR